MKRFISLFNDTYTYGFPSADKPHIIKYLIEGKGYDIAESIIFTAKHGEKIVMKDALKQKTPETGDQTNRNIYLALALISATCIAGIAISKRKGKQEND